MSIFSDRRTSSIHIEVPEEAIHLGCSGLNDTEWRSTGQLSATSLALMSSSASSSSCNWQPLAWEPSPTGGVRPSLPTSALVDGAVSTTAITASLPYSDRARPATHQPPSASSLGWAAYSERERPPTSASQSPSFSPSAPYEVALASPSATVVNLPANPLPRQPIPLRRRKTPFHKAEPRLPSSTASAVAAPIPSSLTQPHQRWSLHSHPASYQVLRPTPLDAGGSPSHPSSLPAHASRPWAPEQHARAQSWDDSNTSCSQPVQYGWDALPTAPPLISPGLPGATGAPGAPGDQPPPPLVPVVGNARGSWSSACNNGSQLYDPSPEAWAHLPAAQGRLELPSPPFGSSLGLTELYETPHSPPCSAVQGAVMAKYREGNSSKRPRKPKRRKRDAASSYSASRKHVCELCDGRVAFSRPSALRTHLLTHTRARDHVCDTCGRGFSVMSNLTRHRKLHATKAAKAFALEGPAGAARVEQQHRALRSKVEAEIDAKKIPPSGLGEQDEEDGEREGRRGENYDEDADYQPKW